MFCKKCSPLQIQYNATKCNGFIIAITYLRKIETPTKHSALEILVLQPELPELKMYCCEGCSREPMASYLTILFQKTSHLIEPDFSVAYAASLIVFFWYFGWHQVVSRSTVILYCVHVEQEDNRNMYRGSYEETFGLGVS